MNWLDFGQLALAAMVVYMVLKFLFKIVLKKFDEQNLQQQCLVKNVEIKTEVGVVAKTCDKISASQEKIAESQKKIVFSQGKLVRLINSVDKRINGRK